MYVCHGTMSMGFCSRPLSGSRTAHGSAWPEPPFWLGFRWLWFCGGHGPGETPGPIPNPEAKAWRGDGTALGRVWESSTPPHLSFVWRGSPFDGNPAIFVFRTVSPDAWGRGPKCVSGHGVRWRPGIAGRHGIRSSPDRVFMIHRPQSSRMVV